MSVQRYRANAINAALLNTLVGVPVTPGDESSTCVDINLSDDSKKSDLDDAMASLGYAFVATSPAYTPPVIIGVATMILEVSGNPNTVVTSTKGSLALEITGPSLYQNTDGATAWALVGALSQISGLVPAFTTAASVTLSVGECRSDDDSFMILASTPLVIDITLSGAGGLDTGVEAASTWYAIWTIADSTGTNPVAGLFSASFSAPTLPAGYDKKRRVGSVRNDTSSNFISFVVFGKNSGRLTMYTNGVATRAVLAGGAAVGTVTAVDLSAFVPPVSRAAALEIGEAGAAVLLTYADPADAASANFFGLAGNNAMVSPHVCSATQAIAYNHMGGGGLASIWVMGYQEDV